MEKKFNIIFFFFKMLIMVCIWLFIVSITINNMPNFPQQLIKIQFNPDNVFSFEISHLAGILIALISQQILFVKGEIYLYPYGTNCKNPVFFIMLNIIFGWFICSVACQNAPEGTAYTDLIPNMFIIMGIINYCIFFSGYGADYRDKKFEEDWNNKVYSNIFEEENKNNKP